VSVDWALNEDPKMLAEQLVEASRDQPAWLAAFTAHLESGTLTDQLRRFLGLWGLSRSDAARVFGVSRQAISKWLRDGVPAARSEQIADLGAATDVLLHYVKVDRIPAVVRRKADRLGGRPLLDLVADGDTRAVLNACRAMFDVSGVHA